MRDELVSVESSSLSLRDLVAPIVRHRTAVAATFLAVLTAAAVAVWFSPPEYVSEMTLLIRRERVDPIVSADPGAPPVQMEVSESELLSEVEILRSNDLLERVVLDTGLHVPDRFSDAAEEARARAAAIDGLRNALDITPVRRTTLIRITYAASEPQLAARVLDRISERYFEKHLAVHRTAGTHEFFTEQVSRARQELEEAERRISAFAQREQVVAPEQERTAALQQLAAFEAALQQARAEAADAERRLAAVQSELVVTPDRQVTSVRTANASLVGTLRGRILEMEIEREALLRKFEPQYPPVVRLEAQLALTRDSLEAAERAPILDETTDQNPTHQWLRNEEARIRAERAALAARVVSIQRSIDEYQARARQLDAQAIEQQELVRSMKAAEEALLLYQRKEEEARIADALDRGRFANVKVADAPTVPQSESTARRALILWLGLITASILSFGVAYVLDWMRPVLYSPRDVHAALDVPVLAAVPASAD